MANPFDQFDQGPPAAVAAAPQANPFDKFDAPAPAPAPAPAAAAPPEAPNETVNRLQPKIDAGSASEDERNQWLDARTADLQNNTLSSRIARTIANAPYSKILPAIGGWVAKTTGDALHTAGAIENPSDLKGSAKAAASIPIGAAAEGASIGKSALNLVGNVGIELSPFSHMSDWAPRVQAQSELQLSDALRHIDPKAVKDLAPDQQAAATGAAAVDVAGALAGPPGEAAAPEIAITQPERLMGVSGSKAIKAAQTVAANSTTDAAKAAGSYMAQALKYAHPVANAVISTAKGAGDLIAKGAKAAAPVLARAGVGGVVGGALGAAAAPPGDTDEAAAQGAAGGALAGAARSPGALEAANGTVEPKGTVLAVKSEPPSLTPVSRFAGNVDPGIASRLGKPVLAQRAPLAEVQGPPPPNAAGVDDANAAATAAAEAAAAAKTPLALKPGEMAAQPVSRLAGGVQAVGGLLDSAQQGNARLRAEVLTGENKVTPALVKDQAPLSDKPLATVGPVPDGQAGDPAALKASQDLGSAMLKQPELDTFMNTLFGGNRGGTGTQTSAVRIHSLPDGATFEVAGQKVQVVRPEGVQGVTVLRTANPNIPDIAIHQPTGPGSEGYTIPTDTGKVEIARLDPENPNPLSIGGEPHQVISAKGMRDPVVLANAAGQQKILASRQILNADKGTIPEMESPVPMTDAVGSSNLKSYGYDAATQTLYVKPKGGGLYAHEGVPLEVAKAMDEAASKGKFYNANVKKQYPNN